MIEFIGFLSAGCFLLSGVPIAAQALRTGRAYAPWGTIGLIVVGSAGMLTYQLATSPHIPPLLNYSATLTAWIVVGAVKLREGANAAQISNH